MSVPTPAIDAWLCDVIDTETHLHEDDGQGGQDARQGRPVTACPYSHDGTVDEPAPDSPTSARTTP